VATTSIGGGGSTTSTGTSSVTTTSTGTSTTTTIASTTSSSSTTTSTGETADSRRYIGTYTPQGGNQLPLDLSAFFNLPKGAKYTVGFAFPRAIFDVTGGYNTGAGSFTGTIAGTLDGTIGNGTFTGVITANLGGCIASRNYTGPLTPSAFNFGGQSHINQCGGATPLTSGMNAPASNQPPTTTAPAAPDLRITYDPSPAPPLPNFTTACSGGNTPRKTWNFRVRIENVGNAPFTIRDWARAIQGEPNQPQDFTAQEFVQVFDTDTIQPGGEVTGNLCAFRTTGTSGEVRFFFNTVGHTFNALLILLN
jgi:hypothetical protein